MGGNELITKNEFEPTDYIPEDLSEDQKKELRASIKKKCREIQTAYINIAEMLYRVKIGKYYYDYGYSSFEEYIKNDITLDLETSLGLRQSQYYIKVYERFVIELKIPSKDVEAIGITKSKVLLNAINDENKDKLISQAKSCSVLELTKEFKPDLIETEIDNISSKTPASVSGSLFVENKDAHNIKVTFNDEVKSIPLGAGKTKTINEGSSVYNIRLYPEQRALVDSAIDLSSLNSGSLSKGNNLGLICGLFLSSTKKAGTEKESIESLEHILTCIANCYDVDITYEKKSSG